eukprot:scaffold4875_cov155-Amphora_coffeaeformis.AAC.4
MSSSATTMSQSSSVASPRTLTLSKRLERYKRKKADRTRAWEEQVSSSEDAEEEASVRMGTSLSTQKPPGVSTTSSQKSQPETVETSHVVDDSPSQVGATTKSTATSTTHRNGSPKGGSSGAIKKDVATTFVKDDDGGRDQPILHLQTSTSSEATPDLDTLLDVQAYIETIHNRCGDESTAPESSESCSRSRNHGNNRRSLHLVQSNDEEAEIVVDSAVVSSIGKYIDTLTATNSTSFDHDAAGVSPEMLSLVQQWIDHLPPSTPQNSKTAERGGNHSFDTMEVDPETMAAVEACMELVTKTNHRTWQGSHFSSSITVGAATVAETHSLASDETGGASEEDLPHVNSDVATRSRVCTRYTDSEDGESHAAVTTASKTLGSDAADSSAPPGEGEGQSVGGAPSLSPVQSAVEFWEKTKTSKSFTDDTTMAAFQKTVASVTSVSKTMHTKPCNSHVRADSAIPNVLSFHSAAVLSQNSAGRYGNLATTPSYRSYGRSSSSSSSGAPSKAVSREALAKNSGGASKAAAAAVDKSGIIGESLCVSSKQSTGPLGSNIVIAQSDDECNPAVNSTMHASCDSARTNNSDSADARIRDLIDAVEGWGGEGSFLEYTAMNGGSLDSGALEALKELVIDAESSTGGDQSTVDDTHVPQELGDELKSYLDAFQARKSGKTVRLPSNLIRVKQDPPAYEPDSELKEDPPIKNTFSHELVRWLSGNENPEPNPQKESPPGEHSSSLLDPECNEPLSHALSVELLAQKHAARTNHLHPDIPPRPPSLTPNASTESSNGEEKQQPSYTEEAGGESTRASGDSCRPSVQPESPSRKLGPPRPEISLLQMNDCEEKKEDPIVFDRNGKKGSCTSRQKSESVADVSSGGDGKLNLTIENTSRASPPISRATSPHPKPETPTSLGGSNRRPRASPRASCNPVPDVVLRSKYFNRICSTLLGDNANDEEKHTLAQLVRVAFADVKQGKLPDGSGKNYGGLSSETLKSFVDAVTHSQKHSERKAIPSEDLQTMKAGKSRTSHHDNEVLTFVEQIATALEMIDEEIPLDFIVGLTDSEANAIEFDINSGFVRRDHAAQDTGAEEEIPWWEATAKLAVVSMDILEGAGEKTDASDNETSDEEASNSNQESESKESGSSKSHKQTSDNSKNPDKAVEDDIDNFWKSQQDLRERRMQFRGKSEKKEKAAELPHLHATSYSYNSQSTGNSGSYSKTTVLSKPTAESLESLDESWLLKRSMAGHGKWSKPQFFSSTKETVLEVDAPEPINGTEASNSILDISCRWREQRNAVFSAHWALSYGTRSSPHTGYQGVDIHSLRDSSKVHRRPAQRRHHRLDNLPWEKREVKQCFLHEQSVVNRNWFGRFKRYSSVTVDMPVCKPRSMEMPVKASEWTEDWYRTPTLPSLGTNLSGSAGAGGDGDASEYYRKYVQEPEGNDFSEDEEDWEDGAPECGTLKNVKVKPGERISRITPDLTSSLRRSRWRKKFFPKGTFPY